MRKLKKTHNKRNNIINKINMKEYIENNKINYKFKHLKHYSENDFKNLSQNFDKNLKISCIEDTKSGI